MIRQSLFKALADPTRRQVLRILRAGSLPAGEIAEHFEMANASVSHHLSLLKQADLVRTERRGQHIVYSLNASVMEDAAQVLMELLDPALKEKKS